uniref:Uncharacterized protein n=1 Tax=Scleropages formosus TaxID=113540 RepID=A0A8C9VYV5_SCLFO
MVIEGVSFPSGSLGLGSLGVPSTLAHLPIVLSHPTMLFRKHTCRVAPSPFAHFNVTHQLQELLTTAEGSILAVGWMYTFPTNKTHFNTCETTIRQFREYRAQGE